MTRRSDPADGCEDERLARAHLSRVAEPGDRAVTGSASPGRWAAVLADLRRGRGPDVWQTRHDRLEESTTELVARGARCGIELLTPADPAWPDGLRDLAELSPRTDPDGGAPICLWVRGQLPACPPPAVAVVGARACTAYGEHVAAELGAGLVTRGWTVVSGAAYGIDAAVHRGALAAADGAASPTVAVLAGGVDRASPAGHEDLLRRTVEAGGAVVSEVPPGTRPAAYRFLLRNRLIAAWGLGVVVVEASHRSGALNTVRTAVDLSRHVAAVPGPVTSTASVGTNRLLRDGAACVTGADDVVELLGRMGLFAPGPTSPGFGATGREEDAQAALAQRSGPHGLRVWQSLRPGRARDLDHLVVEVGLAHRLVATALAGLELAGVAVRGESGWRRGGTVGAGGVVVP
ncbi:DNA-processing protein DprA [Jannaschia sp. R86511]|uniref:DNA-processing protein DprA n=1 Tax=Jannaschia sp. R86511 TaxID=3093853 RepID=UPI0036D3749F